MSRLFNVISVKRDGAYLIFQCGKAHMYSTIYVLIYVYFFISDKLLINAGRLIILSAQLGLVIYNYTCM